MNALMAMIDFFIRQETAVIGHNGEMADMSNPQGHVFGEVFFLVARAPSGKQWAHYATFHDESKALLLQDRVQQAKTVDEQYWHEIEPQYGTQAWLDWNADHPETWND